jgi:predicted DNA binding CopG/RHH family protein
LPVRESNESITFRIESRKLEALRNDAEEKQVSLNTLVNQILTNYIEWDMIAAKAGYVILQKDVLRELFGSTDAETLKRIAAHSVSSSKDTLLLMMGDYNLDVYLSLVKNRAKKSGFIYREYREEKTRKIVIQHDMGRHWSVFFKEHTEQIIHAIGYKARVDYTDNAIVINVET